MTFEEYTARYSSLKSLILHYEEKRALRASDAYRSFLQNVELSGAASEMPTGVFLPENLNERIARAWRLYRKYLVRLARACDMLRDPALRSFAVNRYLYGLTHEEIAQRGHYAIRTVYRQSREVKKQLRGFLLLMMPNARRTPPQTYRLCAKGRQTVASRKKIAEWERRKPHRAEWQRPFTVKPENVCFGRTG